MILTTVSPIWKTNQQTQICCGRGYLAESRTFPSKWFNVHSSKLCTSIHFRSLHIFHTYAHSMWTILTAVILTAGWSADSLSSYDQKFPSNKTAALIFIQFWPIPSKNGMMICDKIRKNKTNSKMKVPYQNQHYQYSFYWDGTVCLTAREKENIY